MSWFDNYEERGILPRSVLGLAAVVFCMGIASAFTGAILYAYYESAQERTENKVEDFVDGFDDQIAVLNEITGGAEITGEGGGGGGGASAETLSALLEKVQPSVWFVSTLDDNGAPSVGSAFVVFSDTRQSFLLASYNTVRAGTVNPPPPLTIRKSGEEVAATVHSFDAALDLALLVVDKADLPPLPFTESSTAVVGQRLFAVSGLGGNGGAVTQGQVADVSSNAIQHDAPIGAAFQGGPLVDSDGSVVAVSSRAYAPLGFDPLAVFFAPPIRSACNTVLICPAGAAPTPG